MWRTDDIVQQVRLAGRHARAQVHVHMCHMHVQVVVCAQAEQTLSAPLAKDTGACRDSCMSVTVKCPDKRVRATVSADRNIHQHGKATQPHAQGILQSLPCHTHGRQSR